MSTLDQVFHVDGELRGGNLPGTYERAIWVRNCLKFTKVLYNNDPTTLP